MLKQYKIGDMSVLEIGRLGFIYSPTSWGGLYFSKNPVQTLVAYKRIAFRVRRTS